MEYRLATIADQQAQTWVKRFDPAYWTVDFPRPMMAGVTTVGAHGLRVDLVFYRKNDLAGLIWASDDRIDHPLLAYETSRDYRRCALRFRWRAAGVKALDAINGPVLTIEGRDATGVAKAWYVRLWNYAVGSPTDAVVTLDFGSLDGGFLLPGEADPVWAGDVDRMFVSMVPEGFDNSAANLSTSQEAWVTLDDVACDGSGSVLAVGDVLVPPHGTGIATGYDDSYNVAPERLVRNIVRLGYRGALVHYVGMSHYYRLEASGAAFCASGTGQALNVACAAWHADWAARLKAAGLGLIVSLSYELFDANCPGGWKQRARSGDPALTGYTPPSTLLSPANTSAMAFLKTVARAFVQIAVAAGQAPRFQIGEPWWWVTPTHGICLYDDAAKAAFGGSPVAIDDVRGTLTAAQKALLDQAGTLLASSTAALLAAVRSDQPACERLLLVYLPGVLDDTAPEVVRANVPSGWASPAFDVLQLEDYDWVTTGNRGASARAAAAITARLGYPVGAQHYFSGFAAAGATGAWSAIVAALGDAQARGVATRTIWALPQVMRDGFLGFRIGEDDMQAFDDVAFPLAIGRSASVEPGFSTAVVTTASGHEQRNADWASARMRYDAGPGVRSEPDVQTLIAFFRARRGAAKAFRFRDPYDDSSNAMTGTPTALDQLLGTGNGVATRFDLIKRYGSGADAELRAITRPQPASVRVAVAGSEITTGWTLDGGTIVFAAAPAIGVEVRAGYRFDVPVRFAEDRLAVSAATFAAGEVANVPLIEVRER